MENEINIHKIPNFQISKEELERIHKSAIESTEEDYLKELGKKHEQEMSSINWLEVPEAKTIITKKIREYQAERKMIIDCIRIFRTYLSKNKNETVVWFWREAYIRYFIAPQIVEIDKHISRLEYQNNSLSKQKKLHKHNNAMEEWKNKVEKARRTPIENLFNLERPKKIGNRIMTRCPLHQEKTGSFYIYLNQNSFYCYGCHKGGDVISFVMLKENLTFQEAVRRLTV